MLHVHLYWSSHLQLPLPLSRSTPPRRLPAPAGQNVRGIRQRRGHRGDREELRKSQLQGLQSEAASGLGRWGKRFLGWVVLWTSLVNVPIAGMICEFFCFTLFRTTKQLCFFTDLGYSESVWWTLVHHPQSYGTCCLLKMKCIWGFSWIIHFMLLQLT